MGLKENDGKGARRVLLKKIATVLAPFSILILTITLLRKTSRRDVVYGRAEHRSTDVINPMMREDNLRKKIHEMHDRHEELDDHIEKLLRKEKLTEAEKEKLIITGSVNLIGLKGSSKTNSIGNFCRLNWEAHKTDPSAVPMFRDLISKSPHCAHSQFDFSIDRAFQKSKEFDKISESQTQVHTMIPNGFVLHESRCGSTLVANSLAAMNPEQTRVYSESAPFLAALTICGEGFTRCSIEDTADILKKVVFLMGRTDDHREKHMFFKIQSAGTKFISVLKVAFPETPWIFVYRDPVEVMMSHLGIPDIEKANCLRSKHHPAPDFLQMISAKGVSLSSLSYEEFCAVHLATLCQKALDEFHATTNGELVNYVDLPNALIDYVIPDHFKVPVSPIEAENIHVVSSTYSKGSHNRQKEWKDDSEKKKIRASDAVVEASQKWLGEIYAQLEKGEEL